MNIDIHHIEKSIMYMSHIHFQSGWYLGENNGRPNQLALLMLMTV